MINYAVNVGNYGNYVLQMIQGNSIFIKYMYIYV